MADPKADDHDPAAYIPELIAEYAEAGDWDAVEELVRLAADPAELAAALSGPPPGKS